MDARLLAGVISAGRVAFGVGLIAAPGRMARGWVGAVADDEAAGVITRGLGGRDVLLGAIALHTVAPRGLGPLTPSDNPRMAARMQLACALADAIDLAAGVAARRALPARGVAATVALAGGAVVAQLLAARALRDAPEPRLKSAGPPA